MTRTLTVPTELYATEPPEARGLTRDEVRMLVARPDGLQHALFGDIRDVLRPGDLLVVNTSATIPAAVEGLRADGSPAVVHFSTSLDGGEWVIELRNSDESTPLWDGFSGEVVQLAGGAEATLTAPKTGSTDGTRLWRASIRAGGSIDDHLARHGRPITYGHLRERWPLAAYQTVFAREPGSAEMPSAGRPFSFRLVTEMVATGITFAPIVLHTGVSSLEAGEPPQEERFHVPAATARLVNETRRAGGRVVAVGTTAVRALETVAAPDGTVVPGRGWTDVVLGPDRTVRAVDGIVTGWHLPGTSHMLLLEAVADRQLVQEAYEAAVTARYLWHEFGDSCLLLR